MRRRALALLAVALLTFLAGCSGSGFGLVPDVAEATAADDGSYEVTVAVTSEEGGTFHDVVVYGYTLEGERVCSVTFGNLTDETATATTVCESFPSLLVPNASGMERTGSGVQFGYVEHHLTLYRGYNGSHRFAEFTTRERATPRNESNTTRLVDESVLSAGKCRQWIDDGNFSTIGDRPWFDWDRRPPNTSVRHYVEVVNATNTTEAEEAYVYSESASTAATAGAIDEHRRENRSVTRTRLNETEFDDAVSALGDRSTNDATASSFNGSVERFNGTGVDCWAEPPRYEGVAAHRITVFLRSDDQVWKLRLANRTEYSGPVRATNGSTATS